MTKALQPQDPYSDLDKSVEVRCGDKKPKLSIRPRSRRPRNKKNHVWLHLQTTNWI